MPERGGERVCVCVCEVQLLCKCMHMCSRYKVVSMYACMCGVQLLRWRAHVCMWCMWCSCYVNVCMRGVQLL